MDLHFSKLQSLGNDFLVIDKNSLDIQLTENIIQKLCHRNYGIGADGVIVYENNVDGIPFVEFFNADGSFASMCGNGLRCLFFKTKANAINTSVGIYQGVVNGSYVSMLMPYPVEKGVHKIEIEGKTFKVYWVNSGVEHVVLESNDLSDKTLFDLGRKIRYHAAFSPYGVNVNFVQWGSQIEMKTYERGVENFTLACGTGALAAFFISNQKELKVKFHGGESCDFLRKSDHIFMKAEAKKVFEGRIDRSFFLGSDQK